MFELLVRNMKLLFPLVLLLVLSRGADAQSMRGVPIFMDLVASSEYINIPGTSVSVRPPKGFRVSRSFTGLQSSQAIVEVFDLKGGVFEVIAAGFTKDKLEAQNAIVDCEEEIEVAGFPGKKLCYEKSGDGQRGYSIIFGDENFTVIMIATYPVSAPAIGEEILGSLMTTRYGHVLPDPFTRSSFVLKQNEMDFSFDKCVANTYYYCNKSNPGEKSYNSYFTITDLAWSFPGSTSEVSDVMTREFEKNGLITSSVSKRRVRVAGKPAIEKIITANRNGINLFLYHVTVMNGTSTVILNAISPRAASVREFRQVAKNLRFKKKTETLH
jgi:hypothetical protein